MANRSIIADYEAMVDSHKALKAAKARAELDDGTLLLKTDEQDAVDRALDFFEDAVETGDQSASVDMESEAGQGVVEGLYALRAIASGEGDVDDADAALREISGFGQAFEKKISAALGA